MFSFSLDFLLLLFMCCGCFSRRLNHLVMFVIVVVSIMVVVFIDGVFV